VVVEGLLFVAGVAVYVRATREKDRIGRYGFWCLIGMLVLIYIANLTGGTPPNTQIIAIAGNASWLFVLWAYWVDRHRQPIGTA
jgi:hypothetical protein